MADLTAMSVEIRARARAEVSLLKHDDVADALPEKLSQVATTPSLYLLIRRVAAAELTPGSKAQRVDVEVIAGIVTASLAPGQVEKTSEAVSAAVIRALHWWKPSGALERLKYRGESDDGVREGPRLGVQHRFTTSVHDTYDT